LPQRSPAEEGGGVLISVSDTGAGLSAAKIDQMFNAFFTTKPQGTGMGLAISARLWSRMPALVGDAE